LEIVGGMKNKDVQRVLGLSRVVSKPKVGVCGVLNLAHS
jgi:hypothetical protein